jgi:hypothetical protein
MPIDKKGHCSLSEQADVTESARGVFLITVRGSCDHPKPPGSLRSDLRMQPNKWPVSKRMVNLILHITGEGYSEESPGVLGFPRKVVPNEGEWPRMTFFFLWASMYDFTSQ